MLHTLTRSPWLFDTEALLRMLSKGDDLLLILDGVLAAIIGSDFVEVFKNIPAKVSALKEDLEARGLTDLTFPQIVVVSYIDLVNLVIKHTSLMNW